MGMGSALYEAIDFQDGRVLNAGFTRYRVPRSNDAPTIETLLVGDADTPSTGAGEPGIVPIAAAIANAVFDRTGERHRELPIQRYLEVALARRIWYQVCHSERSEESSSASSRLQIRRRVRAVRGFSWRRLGFHRVPHIEAGHTPAFDSIDDTCPAAPSPWYVPTIFPARRSHRQPQAC